MSESPTTRPGPEDTPSGESAWLADLAELRRCYGETWLVETVPSDPYAITVTRRHGSEVHVMAGPPGILLAKLDQLPKQAPEPTILRADDGAHITGAQR